MKPFASSLFVVLGALLVLPTQAAEVDLAVSGNATYVGAPVRLNIRIRNSNNHEPPKLEEVDGLSIKAGEPKRSRQVFSINGRRSVTESVVYPFEITPERAGEFTIPPVRIKADGVSSITEAIRITAQVSETGDLLFAEIESEKRKVFVGEPVDVKLKIYVRPFRDPQTQQFVDERSHWEMILSSSDTNWGRFEKALEQLAERNRRPAGKTAKHDDIDGNPESYYLYEIEQRVYPDRPGKIDLGKVKIGVSYPEKVSYRSGFPSIFGGAPMGGFDDDFFGRRLVVEKSRPISAQPDMESIEVVPVPEAGKPGDYRGAVGKYVIATEATPREVVAGDPITLRVGIRGDGPMSLVQPPPLSEIPELVKRFKIADESMGGYVDSDQKLFSTTIRAIDDSVTEIPAIPFSFFDPEKKEYVTVYSRPISLEVKAAEVFSLDDLASSSTNANTVPSNNEVTSALKGLGATVSAATDAQGFVVPELPTQAPEGLLVREEAPSLVPKPLYWWLAFPPIATVLFWGFGALTGALGAMQTSKNVKRKLEKTVDVDGVMEVIATFVISRFSIVPSAPGAASGEAKLAYAIGKLRGQGESRWAVELERLVNESQSQAQLKDDFLSGIKAKATELVDRLAVKSPADESSASGQRVSAAMLIWVLLSFTTNAVIAGGVGLVSASDDVSQDAVSQDKARVVDSSSKPEVPLGLTRDSAILRSALEAFKRGLRCEKPETARPYFAEAAIGFEALVEDGVHNAELFFLLGTTQAKQEQYAFAVANFLRAVRIKPDVHRYRDSLSVAMRLASQGESAAGSGGVSAYEKLQNFASRVPRFACLYVGVSGWVVFWGVLAVRRFCHDTHRRRRGWKLLAAGSLTIVLVCGCVYVLQSRVLQWNHHVVAVASTLDFRSGDDLSFEVIATRNEMAGSVLRWSDQRSGWVRVEFESGSYGWIETANVEFL